MAQQRMRAACLRPYCAFVDDGDVNLWLRIGISPWLATVRQVQMLRYDGFDAGCDARVNDRTFFGAKTPWNTAVAKGGPDRGSV
jgi:hypothetical protein